MSREGRKGPRAFVAVAVTAAVAAALVAPGAIGSSKPHARLAVSDRTPSVGQEVVFDSSRSRGDISYHLWDLDGDKQYEQSTNGRARMTHVFKHAGRVRVTVAVFDDDGAHSVRSATLRVLEHATPSSGAASGGSDRPHVRTATSEKKDKAKEKKDEHGVKKAQSKSGSDTATVQKAASSQAVTISDFKYEPKSVTVSVGTTVNWTNDGPTAHTATADDGTFDTGNLLKGQSGSYKFTKAGKYEYHCAPHPFMKATVTVTGSGGASAGDDSNSNDSSSSSGSGGDSDNDSSLPHTGLRIASFVLAGLLLLGGGVALRRRLARS
ncbi:MAG TPA: plastocyanin/azurin family copper-binding protein [Thermoleophilaceae bacterium]|nr:plastocyanin/azurin family copper-binding protein [Thermoleophilaceae bacterium]